MKAFTKQPGDVLDYDVDMADWFAGIPGDNLQSVAVTVTTDMESVPAMTVGPAPHPEVVLMGANPVSFKVWLGGGNDYIDYIVNCRALTTQDRVKEVEFRVKVREQ